MTTKLLEQTQQYWLISSTWNRRIDGDLTVADALSHMKGIITTNRPTRALSKAAGLLMADLILQKKPKRPKKAVATNTIPMQKHITITT